MRKYAIQQNKLGEYRILINEIPYGEFSGCEYGGGGSPIIFSSLKDAEKKLEKIKKEDASRDARNAWVNV